MMAETRLTLKMADGTEAATLQELREHFDLIKRIENLTPEDCNDAECFMYRGNPIWNGF